MTFDFEIDQEVTVKPLKLRGVVTQRCDRGHGQHDYQVVFWSQSTRKVEWLLPHEIEAIR